MKRDNLATFYKCALMLLFAMISMIVFGNPEGIFTSGSILMGAISLWLFTFIHLDHKVDVLREELRHARQMSKMRYDGGGERQAMSVVPLPREEEEREEA